MNEVDRKILDAMRNNKGEFEHIDGPEDQADVLRQIGRSFRGPFKLMFPVIVLMTLISLGMGIYCGIEMLNSPELASKINWLAGLLLSAMMVVILRLFLFIELNRLSVIREMKRLELQVTLLNEKLAD